jgi:flagellar biosynthesis protein FlhB
MSDQTEEATPKRLQKAREDGDSGSSAFLSQAVAMLVAAAVAPGAVMALSAYGATALRAAIARANDAGGSFDHASVIRDVAMLALPILIASGLAGAVTSVVQSGGVVSMKKLAPKFERLNVIEGLKGLVSGARMFAVVRAFVFASVIAWLAWRGLVAHAADVARVGGSVTNAMHVAGVVARQVAMQAAVIGLFLGGIDAVVVRASWRKRLRMSKADVKREHRESDGDPEVKAARDRARHEMLAAVTVANVKNASVVVVNPTHIACALRYEESEGDETPVVVARGEGDLAKQIIEAARAYGVPVLRDVPLARALSELEIGDAIPEALYEAVAEILREAWEESAPSK